MLKTSPVNLCCLGLMPSDGCATQFGNVKSVLERRSCRKGCAPPVHHPNDLAHPAVERPPTMMIGAQRTRPLVMPLYTPLVTLLAIAYYFFLATRVAVARRTFNVKHPATTGSPEFEGIFRVHLNTLEWLPTFLVPLWLCATYLSDIAAAALGLVWIGGRIWYYVGYSNAVEKRLPGFFVQTSVCLLLFIGAVAGIIKHW